MRPDEETWTDEFGTVWKSPTAWAYAMTCRARQAQQERAERAEQDLAAARSAVVRCRAHSGYLPGASDELLRGLLDSITRICDAALK